MKDRFYLLGLFNSQKVKDIQSINFRINKRDIIG